MSENHTTNSQNEKINQTSADEAIAANLEFLQAENEELRDAMRMRDARDELVKALAERGARTPVLLFESVSEHLQFSADGKLVNAEALAARLKKKFPEQFGFESAGNSIDAGAGRGRAADHLTKERLAQMKPAEIAALDWQEVRRVLSEQ